MCIFQPIRKIIDSDRVEKRRTFRDGEEALILLRVLHFEKDIEEENELRETID